MSILVQKYGGTSVGSAERISAVADRVAEARRAGHRLLVVVSAMGETTDQLMALAHDMTANPSRRELDMLLTAGERISMALLAIALEERGIPAISFTGSQSGILTDERHGRARITEIRPYRLREALERDQVVIVAGFQGVSREKEVTTLGRGGSDTTAVALAATFEGSCEILTDVAGVYTADPRHVPGARLIEKIDATTLRVLARCGAKVVHPRAVDLAAKFDVPLRIASSFEEGEGTIMTSHVSLEGPAVRAVSCAQPVRIVSASHPSGSDEKEAELLRSLQELDTPVEHWQLHRAGDASTARWIVPVREAERLRASWGQSSAANAGWQLAVSEDRALVSLVGYELCQDADLLTKAVTTLTEAGIVVEELRTHPASIGLVIEPAHHEKAVRRLHEVFLESAPVGQKSESAR